MGSVSKLKIEGIKKPPKINKKNETCPKQRIIEILKHKTAPDYLKNEFAKLLTNISSEIYFEIKDEIKKQRNLNEFFLDKFNSWESTILIMDKTSFIVESLKNASDKLSPLEKQKLANNEF